jgi:hypothetical protein
MMTSCAINVYPASTSVDLGQFERQAGGTLGADDPPQLRQLLRVDPSNDGQRHRSGPDRSLDLEHRLMERPEREWQFARRP